MSDTAPLLVMRGICKSYASGDESIPVLRGVDLELGPGEAVAIVGESGCGKSTLLNIAGTLDSPGSGEILLNGRSTAGAGEAELARIRNREIGFVFQLHHLLPHCSVLENVLVPTLPRSAPERQGSTERAMRLLQRVGLDHRLSHRPAQLSGGERQRVAVVRALINSPRLLLADEPTGSLDREASRNLARLLLELNSEEQTGLILVTHSPEIAAMMGRVLELRDGLLHPAA